MIKKKRLKELFNVIFTILLVFTMSFSSFSYDMQEKINDVLVSLEIFDDANNMNSQVTRAEFAKMLIKASKYKDTSVGAYASVCNDVSSDNPYAAYIKKAIETGYMNIYLGGRFKPYDMVTYNDVTLGALSLLGYEKDDFANNKVYTRNKKFEELKLDDNVDKTNGHLLDKKDISNVLYNTLKEKPKGGSESYGLTIFDKLYKDTDGEFNTMGLIRTKLSGPYVAKKGINAESLDIPFDYEYAEIYINGVKASVDDLRNDFENYGYIIYSYDKDKKIVHAYSERADAVATIACKIGYVGEINYSAKSMITPISVDVDDGRYDLLSEDAKILFSSTGSIKKDDRIFLVYNKYNDKYKGNEMNEDIGRLTNGSIIYAIKYDTIY